MTESTIWTAMGHWRGRRFYRRGRWHMLHVRVAGLGFHPQCVRAMNSGSGTLDVAPDTLARIQAGLPTDVPRGQFCKRCLSRAAQAAQSKLHTLSKK